MNRQSQPFPGGPGVRPPPRSICLCCSLCHPACQPSPAQPSRLGSLVVPAQPARGGNGLKSGVCEGLCCFFIFLYLFFAFRALVFPSPEALTPSCASLWLSCPSLHLCHHLPGVSCQLWAQGASGPCQPQLPGWRLEAPASGGAGSLLWLPWAPDLPPCPSPLLTLSPLPSD